MCERDSVGGRASKASTGGSTYHAKLSSQRVTCEDQLQQLLCWLLMHVVLLLCLLLLRLCIVIPVVHQKSVALVPPSLSIAHPLLTTAVQSPPCEPLQPAHFVAGPSAEQSQSTGHTPGRSNKKTTTTLLLTIWLPTTHCMHRYLVTVCSCIHGLQLEL